VTGVPASIARAVREEGGRVTFARFMELALTEPESGYYTRIDPARGRPLLGPHGDFTTAPHKVPAFNRALSRLVAQVVDVMPPGVPQESRNTPACAGERSAPDPARRSS
jgi:SAM-dependent MidA family methyltransferase